MVVAKVPAVAAVAPKSWRRRLLVPLMMAVMGVRFYTKLNDTATEILKSGETPKLDDSMIVGQGAAEELLVRALEAATSASIPDLESGATRSAMGTSKFKALPEGFWLAEAEKRRAAVKKGSGLKLRLFRSRQALKESAKGATELTGGAPCGADADRPHACLCPNCPSRWKTIVYVADSDICRPNWRHHLSSFVDGNGHDVALLKRPGFSDESITQLKKPRTLVPKNRILIVRDDDLRRKPGHTAASVLAWILDAKQKLRDDMAINTHDDSFASSFDSDAIADRVKNLIADDLPGAPCAPTLFTQEDDLHHTRRLLDLLAYDSSQVLAQAIIQINNNNNDDPPPPYEKKTQVTSEGKKTSQEL